ncbi:hypothetical protein BOX15_Mlig019887g1 [Macrostomum lignano]|uniref:Uncharacterized protein n=1 Tax=Macrostomum lignano TaxID=282301 RepID=A0A267GS40_9PLAT|nr:hypothetical protein BOX15_Mlig019887g1 [Macrostomum lignano]
MSQVRLALSDPISSSAAPTVREPATNRERLDQLQATAQRYRKVFNARRVAYKDWHSNKSASFLEALKRLQCIASSSSAPTVASIAEFRELRAQAADLRRLQPQRGAAAAELQRVDEFLNHWRDYLALKEIFELEFVRPLARLLEATEAFRYPAMRADLLKLMERLDAESDERFDFSGLHNTTENLFTYRVPLRDERFLGLMQILPRLLQTGSQVCYFTEQLVSNDTE